MSRNRQQTRDARFATLLDEEGRPPCEPPDACSTCRLFSPQQPGESRSAWLSRITVISSIALEEAS